MSILDHKLRAGLALAGVLAAMGLSACTTVEGTNAMVDVATFEREVASETLLGLGMIPREKKEVIETPRAPLVLPRDTASLPAPKEETVATLLPEDSDKVQIDTSNLTDEDIRRLRNARVVDSRALSGRPLTEAETRKMTARMRAANIDIAQREKRPLFLPPDEYFTTVNGQDVVCLADNGDLVSLSDPACPPDVRAALQAQTN